LSYNKIDPNFNFCTIIGINKNGCKPLKPEPSAIEGREGIWPRFSLQYESDAIRLEDIFYY